MKKKEIKFYYLSILCLIPALGTIFGIVIMFISLFRFRNAFLFSVILIMTIGGIILGFVSNQYLEKELKYGEFTSREFAIWAATDLDTIANKLDYYRKKNGRYPDSLEQLKREYPNLLLMDPLLGRNSHAHKFLNYYYYKKDSTYILFSSGIDGIPNTADDIYPGKSLK